ncbi:hypothetical protein TNCV_4898681 [Trichonephila clavipes]|nr:hypothetical protein TNCV_4898681 [Trichonephila clavipes]
MNDTVTVVQEDGSRWGLFFGSRTDLHVQSVTITGAEFLFMDDNVRPRRANIGRMASIGGYHPYGLASILTDLNQ